MASCKDMEPYRSLLFSIPNVHHLVLPNDDTVAILRAAEGSITVCHWQHLESLTINGYLHRAPHIIDDLGACLRRRPEAGLSKLQLNFTERHPGEKISFAYERLDDLFVVECGMRPPLYSPG